MLDLTDEAVLKMLRDFTDAVMALQPRGWNGELKVRIVRTRGLIVWLYLDQAEEGLQMNR